MTARLALIRLESPVTLVTANVVAATMITLSPRQLVLSA